MRLEESTREVRVDPDDFLGLDAWWVSHEAGVDFGEATGLLGHVDTDGAADEAGSEEAINETTAREMDGPEMARDKVGDGG